MEKGDGRVKLSARCSGSIQDTASGWGWQYVVPSQNRSVDSRGGKIARHRIDDSTVQNAMRIAALEAGIVKPVALHVLRTRPRRTCSRTLRHPDGTGAFQGTRAWRRR
ncbi:MAG: hypothetical protein ACSLFQ_09945 [Thermoanaerobaculia bacterium]